MANPREMVVPFESNLERPRPHRHPDGRSSKAEADGGNVGERRSLSRTIEAEIIPRLMLVHTAPDCAVHEPRPSHEEVDEFVAILLEQDLEVASSFVSLLRSRGATLETLILHLLSPAAHRLDALWREDTVDFCQVTITLSRLQQILREMSSSMEAETGPYVGESRILLASTPGEQHTFGMSVVEEFLRRAGWDVVCMPDASAAELGRLVAREWFDAVGISLSGERLLAGLTSAIDVVRRRSRNPRIGVLVGGRYFNENPEAVGRIGADLAAADGADAVRKAQRWSGGAARHR